LFRQGKDVKSPRSPGWLVARDVEQRRERLNFSTWDEDDG
jgi:hypothetical protein